jgi:nucleoside-diphosphate-sugar epimerase
MRYDLVLNSFTKDAFSCRRLRVDSGGKIWRPLADIQDVAWAYIKALEIPLEEIGGKIFNLCSENWNIGELARMVQRIIKERKKINIDIDILPFGLTRNYKADSSLFIEKFRFKPTRNLEDAIFEIWDRLEKYPDDASKPVCYNDKWEIQLMEADLL